MVSVATDRKLAALVLAILACVALIGFGNGLRSALAAPRASLPGETAGSAAATGAAARDATAVSALDEARIHEIAREEADAALARAKPVTPRKPKAAAPDAEPETPDQPIPYAAPSTAGDVAAPAAAQEPPGGADRG